MIDVNVTLLIQMVSFLIFVFLMNLVLYRPIRRIVAQRQQFVEEQQRVIDEAEAGRAAAVQEFNDKIQDARKLGRQRIQELKAGAYEHEKELIQKAAEQAASQLQATRAKIQGDVASATKKLKAQVDALSKDLAKKILGRNL